jgi:nucleoside-diphosphate kinase
VPEKTFVMIKPDGMQRGLAPEIVSRVIKGGLSITEEKDIYVTREQAERLYSAHRGQKYFEPLVEYLMSGIVKAMRLEGPDAVSVMRGLMGPTNPKDAPAGTIRGDYKFDDPGSKVIKNTVHGSDSAESAARELMIFFEGEDAK